MDRSVSERHGGEPSLWPCGVLGRPHGLRGEISLRPTAEGCSYLSLAERYYVCATPEAVPRPVTVERVGGTDRCQYLRVDGASTRDEAACLTGSLLLASGGGLDDLSQYTVGHLIGLEARSGELTLGRVTDVLEGVTHEILVIVGDRDEQALVPLVEELVSVDLEAGVVLVREGLLE